MTDRTRRSFVTAVVSAGALGSAGCLSNVSGRDGSNGSRPAESSPNAVEDANGDVDGDGNETAAERPDLPGERIASFEPLDDWVSMIDAGTLEAATDDPYAGTQSARLRADDAEYAAVYTTNPHGIDLRESNLSLAVKAAEREQLQLTLELLAPDHRNAVALRRTLIGPTDRWVRVDFGTGRVEGEPSLADVREIRLSVRPRGDSTGPVDCRVDDLRAVDRPETGKVLLLFDGTLESHHSVALERLSEHGFAGVEAIIPEAVGETRSGRLTREQLDDLADAGWDLAARPRTGARSLADYAPDEQAELIRRTKAYLETNGFEDGADYFVAPRNVVGPNTMDLVEDHHEGAFRFGGAPNALPVTDPHNLGFFSGAEGDVTKEYVDRAAEFGQLAVLHFEHVGDDGLSERAFADLLEHVDRADVDVVTATELLDHDRN
ncbi:hypothetical protein CHINAEXTREME_04900 [Halobiforma lacisalsi AJ5]|nr:hypothetical protein [Halobiforma lacisalsi]APX00007.1 hypothetical protein CHINAEXTREME_04900 [Halobiforma lacisalsi AJ5]